MVSFFLACALAPALAPQADLKTVLRRAGEYAADYH
jgi:hypothetical protein